MQNCPDDRRPYGARMEPAASDLDILTELNRNYVRSAEQSDVGWYAENLAEDFLASSVDGSLIDPAEIPARARRPGRWVCVSAHFNRFGGSRQCKTPPAIPLQATPWKRCSG